MTDIQKKALKIMRDKNVGAVLIDGQWFWPEDIRSDNGLAKDVLEHYKED